MSQTRRPAEDIIAAQLEGLLRRELTQGLRGVFEDLLGRGGGGGMQVIINNNAGAMVTARETAGALQQKQLEITIDQMVAQSLTQGRQTTGVLRSLFGLAPGLMGR
jgi:hypothetical protein